MSFLPWGPGLLIVLVCLALVGTAFYSVSSAQAVTPFTPDAAFSIPAYNATVFFALDGSYTQATLQNDTWTFNDLTFSNSVSLSSFSVSAQNCNVTLYFSGLFQGYLRVGEAGLLQYNVTGAGVQRFNFGLSPSFATDVRYRDLMVRFSSEFFTNSSEVVQESEGWQLSSDGSVTVTGAVTGASIMYVDYSQMYADSTQPFYVQHSVTIAAVALVLLLVAVGLALRFRSKKPVEAV